MCKSFLVCPVLRHITSCMRGVCWACEMLYINCMRTLTYRFRKDTTQIRRQVTVAALRKDGFSAWEEYDRDDNNYLLKTNARMSQIVLSVPGPRTIHE